ncbi:tRNA-specific adenosine deaminase [Hamiltosporidium tvaerminnensis]|uniref:tRNA-specific adenosine deaminase n=1 Tax=Hamiltosporidium tvaerminnensis TaxID=1176355 RepID=A0A4Q9M4P4_9MICR|nr:tRNA-specific adenosine deaminase [Hamiltosporidium tvaerminnensis]
MEEDIDFYMEEAFKEAQKALLKKEVPIGAVIVRKHKIIARGHNLTNETNNPLSHAEINALRCLNNDFENLTFYITCEPCIMCMDILYKTQSKFYYGCNNYIFGGNTVLGMNIFRSLNGYLYEMSKCISILKEFYNFENENSPEEKRKKKFKKVLQIN